jgi:nucleotide-binding universal stress UspA family protein
MFTKVLVGVDGTEQSANGVVLGRARAELAGAELVLVHCYATLVDEAADHVEALARGHADSSAKYVAYPDPDPVGGLRDAAEIEHADLIVVSSSHRGPIGHMLLGDVAAGLLHDAPCAVAIAPNGLTADGVTFGTLAVGVDEQGSADGAVTLGAELARATAARRLRLVHVVEPMSPPRAVSRPAAVLEHVDAEVARTNRVVEDARERAGLDVATAEILVGSTTPELIALSREVDLLLLGATRTGLIGRIALGSVSETVAEGTHAPLIVCPNPMTTES